jgi:hypothetical protein
MEAVPRRLNVRRVTRSEDAAFGSLDASADRGLYALAFLCRWHRLS